MIRFPALVAVLVSCVVVAVPGVHASQWLAGSTVCQLVPTWLVAGPDGTVWYTVVNGSDLSGVGRNLGGPPRPIPSPFHMHVSQPVGAGTSIYRMTPHGKVTAFPISRDPQVQFRVDHITSGPHGNLWFTATTGDYNPPRLFIGWMTPQGTTVEYPIRVGGSYWAGIALGADGNIWFSVEGVDMISRITPRGDITEFPAPIVPELLMRGPDGNVWFTTGYSVGRITAQGEVKQVAFASPITALTVGPDGHLWFAGGSQVIRLTAPGVLRRIPIPTVFASNSGVPSLATGSDHNLWFTTTAGVIVRMTLRGQFIGFPLPQGMEYPLILIRGADGNLWFGGFGGAGGWMGRITPQGRVTQFSACPA